MDNAAGVAGLLELGRAFAIAPRPCRSVVFIATTLEESGLLGAEHYAAHPLFPLEQTVGGINMDAVNIFGPTKTMEVTGMGKTTLEDLVADELRKNDRTMQQDPNSVVGFYFRSDHFPFVKRGVPFLFTGSGWELAETRFPNLREPKIGTRFHQPCDEWSESLDFAAAARDLRIYYAVGRRLADSALWPEWKPGVQWKSLRDSSAALRSR
jgi:Zn-dependent M28 family amino/carboxypeptidase